jgi:hypothetical protein
MATYNSAAQREAAQAAEQQRMREMNPEGYAAGAVNPAATPTDPAAAATAPATAPATQPGAVNGVPPPPATSTNVGTAPPWLQQANSPITNLSKTPMDSVGGQQGGDRIVNLSRQQAPETGGYSPTDPTNAPAPGAGVQLHQQQAWEGGPQVTQTRALNEGLPGVQTGLNTSGFAGLDLDFAGAAQRGADAAYEGATQFFDEDFGADTASLTNQLVNQGLQPGTEAFDRQMSLMQRGQNAARTQAAYQAQGVGHQQAGDLLMRALQSRQQMAGEQGQNAAMNLAGRASLMGERERDADRLFNQSLGTAGLAAGVRGQDVNRDMNLQSTSAQMAAASNNAANTRYGIDTNRDLSLRNLGLQQDGMDFNQLMALLGGARQGVNMPNFGGTSPLDVTGANQIAANNNNAQQNRDAADRGALAALGGAALGAGVNYFNGY